MRDASAHGGDSLGRVHGVGGAKAKLAVLIGAPALHFSRLHDDAVFSRPRVKGFYAAGQTHNLLRSGVEGCCGTGARAELRGTSHKTKTDLHEPRARECDSALSRWQFNKNQTCDQPFQPQHLREPDCMMHVRCEPW